MSLVLWEETSALSQIQNQHHRPSIVVFFSLVLTAPMVDVLGVPQGCKFGISNF